MRKFELKNGIKAAYKENKNTPRVALSFNFAINLPEARAGIYSLLSRLLLQGTKTRSASALADELDENAIELFCDMKQDYLRFRFVCLNEDFEAAVEILSDIIKNSTLEEFEKEREKTKGEIIAELDSAHTKALDNYYKTIFENHYYGNSYTKILEEIDSIKNNEVEEAYHEIISHGEKALVLAGDLNFEYANEILNKYFGDLPNSEIGVKKISSPSLVREKFSEVIKSDAQQAQIIKGWIVPTFDNEDYPALVLLNVILGASGLSSRLFVNLRDKKGLAYVVRSSYEAYSACANFSVYIATEPKNIQVSLEGFIEEVDKLKQEPVSEIELANAKNNIVGKQMFITETNSQQANLMAYYQISGLGFDFQQKIIDKIKKISANDVQRTAQKYLDDKFVVSILKP